MLVEKSPCMMTGRVQTPLNSNHKVACIQFLSFTSRYYILDRSHHRTRYRNTKLGRSYCVGGDSFRQSR